MESKRTVHKRRAQEETWKSNATVSSCPQDRRLTEAVVLLERDIKDRAKTTSVENARTRHVIFGILPHVNITKHNRDADSVKSASLCQPNKKLKKAVKVLEPF